MESGLKNKPFLNISCELNNIRIYKINNNYFMYIVDSDNILPVESKYAIKIVNEVLEKTNGSHLSNLTFAYPSTYNDKDKIKIKKLCEAQVLDKQTLLSMLLLLK